MSVAPHVRDTILKQLGPEYAHAYPKQVEQEYPHVLEKIAGLSGAAEMDRFFEDLLLTQRTDRKGFSTEAFGELLTLINVYRQIGLLREPPKKEGDIWNWARDIVGLRISNG